MSDFKAKMYQIQFRLGLRPRPRWRSLQRSTRPPSWIKGPTSKGKGEEGREGGGEEMRPHPFTPPYPIFLDTPLLDVGLAYLSLCGRSSLNTRSTIK